MPERLLRRLSLRRIEQVSAVASLVAAGVADCCPAGWWQMREPALLASAQDRGRFENGQRSGPWLYE